MTEIRVVERDGVWQARFDDTSGEEKRLSTRVKVADDPKGKLAAEKATEVVNAYLRKAVRPSSRTTDSKEAGAQDESASTNSQKTKANKRREIPTHPNLTWALEEVWRTKWSKSRSAINLQYVIPEMQRRIGHWYLDEITTKMIQDYMEDLEEEGETKKSGGEDDEEGLSPSTINKRRAYIRRALGVAKSLGALKEIPVMPERLKERNTKIRYLKPSEESAILQWFERMEQDDTASKRPEWRFMREATVFLIDTGFRFSEMLKFTVPSEVSPEIDGRFADLPFDGTKNDQPRRIPLTARARAAAEYIQASPCYVRTTVEREIQRVWAWCDHRFSRACREVGINKEDTPRKEKVTIHTLRHTTASRLVQRGVAIKVVKDWMGHKSIATTMRYAHLAPDNFMNALAALEGKPTMAVRAAAA